MNNNPIISDGYFILSTKERIRKAAEISPVGFRIFMEYQTRDLLRDVSNDISGSYAVLNAVRRKDRYEII